MFWLKKYENSENFITDYQHRALNAWSLIQKDRSNNVINSCNRPGAYKYNGEIYYDVLQYNKSNINNNFLNPHVSSTLIILLYTFPNSFQIDKQSFYGTFNSLLENDTTLLIPYDINAILENQRNNYVPTASIFFNSFRIASFYGFDNSNSSNPCYSAAPTFDSMINYDAFSFADISFNNETSITRLGYLKDWLIDTFVS